MNYPLSRMLTFGFILTSFTATVVLAKSSYLPISSLSFFAKHMVSQMESSDDGISGIWEGTISVQAPEFTPPPMAFTMEIQLHKDASVTGNLSGPMGAFDFTGTYNKPESSLTISVEGPEGDEDEGPTVFTVDGENIRAEKSEDGFDVVIEATRTEIFESKSGDTEAEQDNDQEIEEMTEEEVAEESVDDDLELEEKEEAPEEQLSEEEVASKARTEEQKKMRDEMADWKLQYEYLLAKQRSSWNAWSLEQAEMKAKQDYEKAKAANKTIEMQREMDAWKFQMQYDKAKLEKELNSMRNEVTRLNTEVQIALARSKNESNKLDNEIKAWKKLWESESMVMDAVPYTEEPLIDGILHITDRRIPLNGPIMSGGYYGKGTADEVTERIHYFNNKSKSLPIFIIIDNCPGGSVMEGYRILKAMESSEAPIHVVVKSFAASMAACITTMAEHSYAYPNAIILHHQISGGVSGNLRQQEESVEEAKEWMRRLADPIAKKMGITLDELVAQMYENNSDGDWSEFANKAKQLRWVNETIDGVREYGIIKRPSDKGSGLGGGYSIAFSDEPSIDGKQVNSNMKYNARSDFVKVDSQGREYFKLPRLQPFDFWWMYDPSDYYR